MVTNIMVNIRSTAQCSVLMHSVLGSNAMRCFQDTQFELSFGCSMSACRCRAPLRATCHSMRRPPFQLWALCCLVVDLCGCSSLLVSRVFCLVLTAALLLHKVLRCCRCNIISLLISHQGLRGCIRQGRAGQLGSCTAPIDTLLHCGYARHPHTYSTMTLCCSCCIWSGLLLCPSNQPRLWLLHP
jgi:hypothetical protein